MNRFVVEGLVREAQRGKRVACASLRVEHQAVLDAAGRAEGACSTVRANGRQRVDFTSGGSIAMFSTDPAAVRGLSLDVLYLDLAAELAYSRNLYADAIPTGAEIIRL